MQKTLQESEKYGDERYSGRDINFDDYKEIDCDLVHKNTKTRKGIFFSRKMTEPEKVIRLWLAILRATYQKAPSRDKKSAPDVLVNIFGDERAAEVENRPKRGENFKMGQLNMSTTKLLLLEEVSRRSLHQMATLQQDHQAHVDVWLPTHRLGHHQGVGYHQNQWMWTKT